jgi:cob(I)alamin adenosyltransferase
MFTQDHAMGHRLSKIYTRTGDDGTTGLGDGTRVAKTHPRIEAAGTIDEANSAVGMVLSADALPELMQQLLTRVQHELFDLGGELAIPGHRIISEAHVKRLEEYLEQLNQNLPPLKEFILPGGGPATAACHLARAITRRAERCAWALAQQEPVARELLCYLNRLSDLLFVSARVLARHERGAEVLWQRSDG